MVLVDFDLRTLVAGDRDGDVFRLDRESHLCVDAFALDRGHAAHLVRILVTLLYFSWIL